jgi:hypothetical protein
VFAEIAAPLRADLRRAAAVGIEIGDIHGHARDVRRAAAGRAHHREHVIERDAELLGEVVGLEDALALPADQARDEEDALPLARRDHPVRVTAWARPLGDVHSLELSQLRLRSR